VIRIILRNVWANYLRGSDIRIASRLVALTPFREPANVQRVGNCWVTFVPGAAVHDRLVVLAHSEKNESTDAECLRVVRPQPQGLIAIGQSGTEYEATLRTAPNRFNALSGAARAARLSGENEKAKTYYAKLLANCEHADGDRRELQEARNLLAQK